jgi:thioredoxin reductase
MIRNYLGFPRGAIGRQLTRPAMDQTGLFDAELVFDRATRLDGTRSRPVIT